MGRKDDSTNRERANKSARKAKRSIQDVAERWPADPTGELAELRERCFVSLQDALRILFNPAFPLDFSPDHERLIRELETVIRDGGLNALAMPRGSGKTTIVVRAALWALLTRLRRFVVMVAATETAAGKLLKAAKTELLHNKRIAELFPRETFLLRELKGEARLAGGQKFNENPTDVVWQHNEINFGFCGATTDGSALTSCGITGNIRGQQCAQQDGTILRPDCAIIEDFQTKQTAKSQAKERYDLMVGDVLGMDGPDGNGIAGIAAGTVILPGDAMDMVLESRQWRGHRCSLVYEWPTNEKIWDQWRAIWEDELDAGGDGHRSDQFILDNFDEMHAGARGGWEQRKPDSVSWLHYAYKLRFRDEDTFWSEYQNQPQKDEDAAVYEMDPKAIASRLNNCPRGVLPVGTQKVTAFADVQKKALYFMVCAWESCGRGHVVDYGTMPDQNREYFTKKQVRRTLADRYAAEDLNSAIYGGLGELFDHPENGLFSVKFRREDVRAGESIFRLDRAGVDARWGDSTETVRRFCRESANAGKIHPVFGFAKADFHQWRHKTGDLVGNHCKLQAPATGVGVCELFSAVNWWKTTVAERLTCGAGADHAILLFGSNPRTHRMATDHFCNETCKVSRADDGYQTTKWIQPDSAENEFWDCLVGCAVLASLEGIRFGNQANVRQAPRKAKRIKRPVRQAEW